MPELVHISVGVHALREGDEGGALDALQAALDAGFKRLRSLEETEDFRELAQTPRFQEMLATLEEGEPDDGDFGDAQSP